MMRHEKYAWRDVTGYSRNDSERTPNTWECHFQSFRIVVWKSPHTAGTYAWRTVGHLDVEDQVIETSDPAEARSKALQGVRDYLASLHLDVTMHHAGVTGPFTR